MFANNKFRPKAEWENKDDNSESKTPIFDKLFGGNTSGAGNSSVSTAESDSSKLDTLKNSVIAGVNAAGGVKETESNGFKSWSDTDEGQAAHGAYLEASDAVKNYGGFTFAGQGDLDAIVSRILNREDFSYDLDGDALYQQYKDKYIKQGQMAMEDTIGQTAALTGGYGNSWAQTAGQQAYYNQLDQLNDVIPELYQLAYDKHKSESDALYDRYALLAAERNDAYGKWADGYQRLVDAEERARSEYDYGRSEYMDDMLTEIGLQPEEEEFKSYINNMSANEFKEHLNNYEGDPDALNEFLKMCVNQGMISPEQSLFYYTMMVEGKDVEDK